MKRTIAVRRFDSDRGDNVVWDRVDDDGKEICGCLYWL